MNLLPASANEKRRRPQSILLHESAPFGYKKLGTCLYPAFHTTIITHAHALVMSHFVQIFSRTFHGKFPPFLETQFRNACLLIVQFGMVEL